MDLPVITIDISLKEIIDEIKAVVITAGSFEAGDKKRTTVLKSVDIVTTAGQQADLVSALRTLPGAQQVGEQEGLFVRGGTGAETKVFIDGMMVNNPFYSSVPDIAQRGRFSPLLFKGTNFSSGGYSAQYGQGMSSALILETHDLPTRAEINAIVSSAQLSVMAQSLNKAKNTSVGLNLHYSNLAPYFSVIKQKINYSKPPESLNAELFARKKNKKGLYKFYAYTNTGGISFSKPGTGDPGKLDHFHLSNKNLFSIATYTGKLSRGWYIYAGTSLSANKDNIQLYSTQSDSVQSRFQPVISNTTLQAKTILTNYFAGMSKLDAGVEVQSMNDKIHAPDSIERIQINDRYLAAFAEADVYYSSRLVQRMGIRTEYSSLLNKLVVSPRLSIAYKLTSKSQFSFAYGIYNQKPETNFLFRKQDLTFSRSTHYILNFQRTVPGKTFRTEIFYKKYAQLVTFSKSNINAISNDGTGYAKGFELFWRDKKSIKGLDYWISYSYLDTKRKFLSYPSLVRPSFAATHTATVVLKSFVSALSSTFSTTYTYASGRPYHDPNKQPGPFMSERTIDYHSLGAQVNYLTSFGKLNAVFILNVNNVIGNPQVFGYHFSNDRVNGAYAKQPISPMAKRFVFTGVYLSLGAEKRTNILD